MKRQLAFAHDRAASARFTEQTSGFLAGKEPHADCPEAQPTPGQ